MGNVRGEKKKLSVLFLCTGNSCRSQMAEAWANNLKSDTLTAYSAGVAPGRPDPLAIEVMAEAGVDISGCRSKSVENCDAKDFDYVVTVCDHARETCPVFPGRAKNIHAGFADPPAITSGWSDRERKMEVYRQVRDQIKTFVETFPDEISLDRF